MKALATLALAAAISLTLAACSQLPSGSKKAADDSDQSATTAQTTAANNSSNAVQAGGVVSQAPAEQAPAPVGLAGNGAGPGQLSADQIAALFAALSGPKPVVASAPGAGAASAPAPATIPASNVQQAVQASFTKNLANHPGLLSTAQVASLSNPLAQFIQTASGHDAAGSAAAWNGFVNVLGQIKAQHGSQFALGGVADATTSSLGVGGGGLVSDVLSILGPYGVAGGLGRAVGGVLGTATSTVAGILSVALQAVQAVLLGSPEGLAAAVDNLVIVVINFLL